MATLWTATNADSVPLTPREAASGLLGSISLTCWIFLLVSPLILYSLPILQAILTSFEVPQLIENYRNGNAEAISLLFLFVWFLGDITNLIGGAWAGLVPVIVAIAVYFCIADGVLIGQCLYYKARNSRQPRPRRRTSSSVFEPSTPDPTTPLLGRRFSDAYAHTQTGEIVDNPRNSTRRAESSSDDMLAKIVEENDVGRKAWVKNFSSVLGICVIGMAGWTVAWRTGVWKPAPVEEGLGGVDMAPGAMVLGYISAVCYLGYVYFSTLGWGE